MGEGTALRNPGLAKNPKGITPVRTRMHQLIRQVMEFEANHKCDNPDCAYDKENARSTGQATLAVFRGVTDLQTEDLVETLHGVTMWLEGIQEYNETLEGTPEEEDMFDLVDLSNAVKSAMFVLGEELIALQDMNIIPQE